MPKKFFKIRSNYSFISKKKCFLVWDLSSEIAGVSGPDYLKNEVC